MAPSDATAALAAYVVLALGLDASQVEVLPSRLRPESVAPRPTLPYAYVHRVSDRALGSWHRKATDTADTSDPALVVEELSRSREQTTDVDLVSSDDALDLAAGLSARCREEDCLAQQIEAGIAIVEIVDRPLEEQGARRDPAWGATYENRAQVRIIARYRETRTVAVPWLETAIVENEIT